jgi:hypothetical protein
MANFNYEGFTRDGKPLVGVQAANSEGEAAATLRGKDIFAMKIWPEGQGAQLALDHAKASTAPAPTPPPCEKERACSPPMNWQETLNDEIEAVRVVGKFLRETEKKVPKGEQARWRKQAEAIQASLLEKAMNRVVQKIVNDKRAARELGE